MKSRLKTVTSVQLKMTEDEQEKLLNELYTLVLPGDKYPYLIQLCEAMENTW